jgi:hypothetical protein
MVVRTKRCRMTVLVARRIAFDAEHRQRQDQRRDDHGAAADAEQAGQKAGQGAKPDQQRPACGQNRGAFAHDIGALLEDPSRSLSKANAAKLCGASGEASSDEVRQMAPA